MREKRQEDRQRTFRRIGTHLGELKTGPTANLRELKIQRRAGFKPFFRDCGSWRTVSAVLVSFLQACRLRNPMTCQSGSFAWFQSETRFDRASRTTCSAVSGQVPSAVMCPILRFVWAECFPYKCRWTLLTESTAFCVQSVGRCCPSRLAIAATGATLVIATLGRPQTVLSCNSN